MWSNSKNDHSEANMLRRFDFPHGENASYIPRSNFPKRVRPDVLAFVRCTSDAVFAYSPQASILVELQYKSQTPRIYQVSTPQALVVGGLAVTNSDAVYGLLTDPPNRNNDSGQNGMYFLALDDRTQTAQWQPVEGAVGRRTDTGVVLDVLGGGRRKCGGRPGWGPGGNHSSPLGHCPSKITPKIENHCGSGIGDAA